MRSITRCVVAAVALTVAPLAEAAGGHGGGGGHGAGGGGFGGGNRGGGFNHAGGDNLRIHGGGSANGGFHGRDGFANRERGSGFGYNGGYFGQGTYLPFGSGNCLSRIDGPYGPRFRRTC